MVFGHVACEITYYCSSVFWEGGIMRFREKCFNALEPYCDRVLQVNDLASHNDLELIDFGIGKEEC
jgi:hypothetical protein